MCWLYKYRYLRHAFLFLLTWDRSHLLEMDHYFYSKTPTRYTVRLTQTEKRILFLLKLIAVTIASYKIFIHFNVFK